MRNMSQKRRGKSGGRSYRLWIRDDAGCRESILRGENVEVVPSAYGENDFFIEFLMGSGLWQKIVGMYPDILKKDNGKPWKALNGVELIRELADVDRISHCGKVLSDLRLMMIAGFNIEEVMRARESGKFIIDPETLGNHLNRISPTSCQKTMLEHVKLLRKKRWIRGGVYVADAHEIIVPYGREFEKLGQVGKKYGYKLVILLNIEPDRERIVGFSLAPLQRSERAMLKGILERLDKEVCPIKKMIKVLILDRGYWGANFLLGLNKRYKFQIVTRARDANLDIVKDIEGLLKSGSSEWKKYREKRSRLGKIQVKCIGVEDLPLHNERGKKLGEVNAVVADEYDQNGKRLLDEKGRIRPRMYYITTMPTEKTPYRIRKYYLSRWVVENQGFRELTQKWHIDTLAARKFNAIYSKVAFVLMLYNGERILRMKHPNDWREEKDRLKGIGLKSLIGGPCLVAYNQKWSLGIISVNEYRRLIIQADRQAIYQKLRRAAKTGKTVEELVSSFEEYLKL